MANILQWEGLDAGIGKAPLDDPVDMVIVGLVSAGVKVPEPAWIDILAVLVGEKFLLGIGS